MAEIQNPYAQATVENFRRTPANLRPQLLEMLARELNGSEGDDPDSTGSFRRVPYEDRAEEFQWLAENSVHYPGEWVALLGKQLLAHHNDYAEVSRRVKSLGARNVMFMFIEPEESEDFVRFLP